jgi:hypothetical protein
LEVKHAADVVLCWKTRGQVDAKVDAHANFEEEESEPIIAKAGIKLPSSLERISPEAFDPYYLRFKDHEQDAWFEDEIISDMGDAFWEPSGFKIAVRNDYMVELFLNRKTGQKFKTSQLVSMRDMFKNNTDMISQEGDQLLNMDYDWKRELIDPVEREHGATSFDEDFPFPETHIYAETRPWKSSEEFRRIRDLFDAWRIYKGGVLKTMEDWRNWQEYVQTDALSKKGLRRGKGGIVDQLKRNFLQAYANEEWGLPGGDYKGVAEHLTKHGYTTSVTDIKNMKRRKGELVQNGFPQTEEVMAFIKAVQERYPSFKFKVMLEADS